jgi:hypothetical protein
MEARRKRGREGSGEKRLREHNNTLPLPPKQRNECIKQQAGRMQNCNF